MSIKHHFAIMRIAEKFAIGKVLTYRKTFVNELFQNLKKNDMGFFYLYEVLQVHCVKVLGGDFFFCFLL